MTDQLWPDSTGLFLVKFMLRLVQTHDANSVEVKNYIYVSVVSDYCL